MSLPSSPTNALIQKSYFKSTSESLATYSMIKKGKKKTKNRTKQCFPLPLPQVAPKPIANEDLSIS